MQALRTVSFEHPHPKVRLSYVRCFQGVIMYTHDLFMGGSKGYVGSFKRVIAVVL